MRSTDAPDTRASVELFSQAARFSSPPMPRRPPVPQPTPRPASIVLPYDGKKLEKGFPSCRFPHRNDLSAVSMPAAKKTARYYRHQNSGI
jgi:hypothetical protein